jgi:hypothetical protein
LFTVDQRDLPNENVTLFHILKANDTMNTNSKFWASPFAIGAFILSIITGLLFFLNVMAGMSQSIQVWLSCLFIIAVVLHTVLNWKQFT